MSEREIEQIELTIEEASKMARIGEKALALSTNKLFKEIVMDGYFVQEAARLALLSSDPNIPENVRTYILRDMNGPGAFKRYLQTLVQMGNQARREVEESRETLQELMDEELTGGDMVPEGDNL